MNGWRGASPPESSVNTAIDAAIHTSLPTHGASSLGDSVPWRPKGILATHLVEHKKAVNRIAVAGNGSFFVTVSEDETAKVWDCRRLERDVSFRSRLTFSPKVKIQSSSGPIRTPDIVQEDVSAYIIEGNRLWGLG